MTINKDKSGIYVENKYLINFSFVKFNTNYEEQNDDLQP